MSFTEVQLQYHHPSYVQADLENIAIHLSPDGQRTPTFFQGTLRDPLRFREALSALYHVIGSDFRYKAKDRSAYMQYLQRQALKDSSVKISAKNLKKAEEAILDKLQSGEDEAQNTDIFDPLITIHPDETFLEVFSKDESTYAKLSIKWDVFEDVKDPRYGTTHIDFSEGFYNSLQNLRTYKKAQLAIDPESFDKTTSKEEGDFHKDLRIPDSWLRGFLQVQSAASLPMTHFELDPIDMYNTLTYLRMNKAKKSPRGLRFELLPQQPPRIILEPWEEVFFGQGAPYQGRDSQIIRTWGRKRLQLLARLLPLTQTIHVYTLGSGLPTFYVLDMGDMTFTLGLSGWTNNDWSSSVQFELMFPRDKADDSLRGQLRENLQQSWFVSMGDLVDDLDASKEQIEAALQLECREGRVIYDLASDVYRYRELSSQPIETEKLLFRNDREKLAHQLVEKDAATITKLNHVIGSGTEIHGEIEDKEAYRTYKSSFFLTLDGRLTRAKCSSPWFQKTQFKEGPSEYILALFLLYNRQTSAQEALRKSGEDRQIIVAETRALTKRTGSVEQLVQLTLDHKKLHVQWGQRGTELRTQKLHFNSPEEARQEYFARIDGLHNKGYIDTEA